MSMCQKLLPQSQLQIIVALLSDIAAIKAAFTQATRDLLLVFDVVDNHWDVYMSRFGDMNERVVEYGRTSRSTEERDQSSSATIDCQTSNVKSNIQCVHD